MVELENGWTVDPVIDDDGHLNIYINNNDMTDISDVESGQGDGTNGEQLALRFTTARIERECNE
jgi:hypothetical protein